MQVSNKNTRLDLHCVYVYTYIFLFIFGYLYSQISILFIPVLCVYFRFCECTHCDIQKLLFAAKLHSILSTNFCLFTNRSLNVYITREKLSYKFNIKTKVKFSNKKHINLLCIMIFQKSHNPQTHN